MNDRVLIRYEIHNDGDYQVIIETDPYEQRAASAIYLDAEQARIVHNRLNKIVPKLDEIVKLLRELDK